MFKRTARLTSSDDQDQAKTKKASPDTRQILHLAGIMPGWWLDENSDILPLNHGIVDDCTVAIDNHQCYAYRGDCSAAWNQSC